MITSANELFAQNLGVREVPLNVAQLTSSASVEVRQDLLAIAMTTSATGTDANAVQTQLKVALDAALAIARPQAAPGQLDVRTGNFSLYPRYDKNGKVNGWQGSSELVMEGRDFARITSTAGKIQSLTLGNVSFGLSREQRARVEGDAQAQAIERFKTKALEVSKGFGFSGYTLREVSINANDPGFAPRGRPMMAMAKSADMESAPIPVEAGKSTVQVTVTGAVQMR